MGKVIGEFSTLYRETYDATHNKQYTRNEREYGLSTQTKNDP
jgi:hypothetical protein